MIKTKIANYQNIVFFKLSEGYLRANKLHFYSVNPKKLTIGIDLCIFLLYNFKKR